MSYIYDLWDDFLSLLFPRLCYGCGDHLLRNEELMCTACHAIIPRTNFHLEPGNHVEQLFWGRCMIERAAVFSYYNKGSRIRNLIHNLKYKGISEIGPKLGRIYGSSLKGSEFLSDIDLIIPVPLHPSKKRLRGYNQSDLIAEGLSAATGIQVSSNVLARVKKSTTQTRRARYDRWTNVDGIFYIADNEILKGMHVLLVDDVITTGSTIESCANEILKTEGAKVSVLAMAFAVV